jgi:NAD(P)-dependent dehydrogenase (short-subunit alcohol dehydrogenase family)
MARLAGKTAIVTGASKGIGGGIATTLASEGARAHENHPPGWLGIRLRAACVRGHLSLGRGVAVRIVGQDARPETLCEVSRVHGGSELVHAASHGPAPRVGGDGCRDIAGNPADIRMVVAMGLARERRSAGDVRDSDGDFLWAQITDGLLGVLGFGRGGLAGPASV